MTTAIQVLREIDKLDKIGLDGVCAMLGNGLKDASGAFNKGVGLDPLQIGMVRLFLANSKGATDVETIANLKQTMSHLNKIKSRIDLMVALEDNIVNNVTGETSWDCLLAMPQNSDETWGDNSRPANIAWALDDMIGAITARAAVSASDPALPQPESPTP